MSRVGSMTFRQLDDVAPLSYTLAQMFPAPDQFRLGIYELLVNAVEHGNLGLGFESKTALLREGRWEEEIERRLAAPEYRERKVSVKFSRNDRLCSLCIADQGEGFPWKRHLEQMTGGTRPNGRGLLIAFHCGFDRIRFNGAGNRIVCAAKYENAH